ncbi:membrane protein FxsA [Devosia pacifica]|uniref:Membrane protein FxsA n=1 Tax=Devosia pacifica TaxID=1335967 RepID=A0A918S3Y4_9HYPH|nr:FxsA family protein [Devosia pacifica]GHA23351.1 membrane protein FxsA [Devosia pacifica]
MARLFIAALLLMPLIEIAVMIKVGQIIGLLPTLALLVGAGLLGMVLIRQQGLSMVMQMRRNVAAGELPARAVADAMMIGFAAVLLLLPGFLTDIGALLLLLPPVRDFIYRSLARNMVVVTTTGPRGGPYGRGGDGRRVPGPDTIELDEDDYRRE